MDQCEVEPSLAIFNYTEDGKLCIIHFLISPTSFDFEKVSGSEKHKLRIYEQKNKLLAPISAFVQLWNQNPHNHHFY